MLTWSDILGNIVGHKPVFAVNDRNSVNFLCMLGNTVLKTPIRHLYTEFLIESVDFDTTTVSKVINAFLFIPCTSLKISVSVLSNTFQLKVWIQKLEI